MVNSIEIRNALKIYGFKGQNEKVLNDFSMTVPRGIIYCLLGASACGKTTLISCILGVKKLNSGTIKVLQENVIHGRPINSINSIGYMPQETALSPIMTIRETLEFFSNISRMDMKLFKARYQMLMDMLELPSENILIENLSGGQKRRVSLAVALIHNPELLILDEPTVGLDVMICHKIWHFLKSSITENKSFSVLMSTHYPHEAEKANICAFMRNGKLLSECSPNAIMTTLNAQNLDEAMFTLCYRKQTNCLQSKMTLVEIISEKGSQTEMIVVGSKTDLKTMNIQVIRALTLKKFIWMKRSRIAMMGAVLPLFLLILLIFTAARPPIGLKLGIFNDENVNCSALLEKNISHDCTNEGLSCLLINEIADHSIQKINYNSFQSAFNDIKGGNIDGFIYIPSKFSKMLLTLKRYKNYAEFRNSFISIYLDNTNIYKYGYLSSKLNKFYIKFIRNTMNKCNRPEKIYLSQFVFKNFEGEDIAIEFDFRETILPSMFLVIIIAASGIIMIYSISQYKYEYIWNRILLTGVSISQLMIVEMFVSIILTFIHLIETLLISVIFLNYAHTKSYGSIIGLVVLTSLTGNSYGVLISAVFDSFSIISSLAILTLMILTIAGGSILPIESMHPLIKIFMEYLPTGRPSIALRNTIFKGCDMTHSSLQSSYVILLMWMIGMNMITFIFLSKKKYV